MIEAFRLPDLGEGLPEAELISWQVAEGDTVTLNQTIAEVETAKAVVELPSPHAGVIRTLHAAAGDVVEVGSVLVSFELDGPAGDAPAAAGDHSDHDADEKAGPNLVGYGAAPRATGRPQRRTRSGAADRSAAVDSAVRAAAPHDAITRHDPPDVLVERPRSTPPVRKRAKDLGVDLALIVGSGPDGLIVRADVDQYAQRVGVDPTREDLSSPAPASADVRDGVAGRTTRTPIRGVTKHMAEAMVRSAFTAPHVTTFVTVDVTATTELVASLKNDRALSGHRIGIMAVAAKAVCLALTRHPRVNSAWDDDNSEIVEHHYVNLGIAAATGRGLVVPNIRAADAMSLVELADAISELADTARAGKTAPAQMSGGTFSITNVGVFGVDAGTPIINPGEAAILALGAVRRQPWEHRGEIALRDVMTIGLSFDHRLVDGEQGSRFMMDVAGVLREPGRAMLLR